VSIGVRSFCFLFFHVKIFPSFIEEHCNLTMNRRVLNAAVAALVAQHAVGMPAGRPLATRADARPQTTSTATGPADTKPSTGTNSGQFTVCPPTISHIALGFSTLSLKPFFQDTVVVYSPAHTQDTTTNIIPYGWAASTVTETGQSVDTVVVYSPSALTKTHAQTTQTHTLDRSASPYTSTVVGRSTDSDTVIIGSPSQPPPTATAVSTIENGSQPSSYTSGMLSAFNNSAVPSQDIFFFFLFHRCLYFGLLGV
jgi:hypothetical protein